MLRKLRHLDCLKRGLISKIMTKFITFSKIGYQTNLKYKNIKDKNSVNNIRESFQNMKIHKLLDNLKSSFDQLSDNEKFRVLEIIILKVENEDNSFAIKIELSKSPEFGKLCDFFYEKYDNFEGFEKIFLIGLFAYITRVNQINQKFAVHLDKFIMFIENNHEKIEQEKIAICLSLYGFFRPNFPPEHFLKNRLFEFELYSFTQLKTSMKIILNWKYFYLNKYNFHKYFSDIFVKLAFKENYHNISIGFKIISKLDSMLLVTDCERNIVLIFEVLQSRVEEIDEQSVINILMAMKTCIYVDFTNFLLKIDDIIYKSLHSSENNFKFLFKYLHYLSFLDQKLLKKIKNFNEYFRLIQNHLTNDTVMDYLVSINFLMKKVEIYDEELFQKQFDILIDKLYEKFPDDALYASLELIKKYKGEKGLSTLDKNVSDHYKKKLLEIKAKFKLLGCLVKITHLTSDENLKNLYLEKLLLSIKTSIIDAGSICIFLKQYINNSQEEINKDYQIKIEETIVSVLNADIINFYTNFAKTEVKCVFIIYLNELKNDNNKQFIDEIQLIISKSNLFMKGIMRYMFDNSRFKVSSKFIDLLLYYLNLILNEYQEMININLWENVILIICSFLQNKTMDNETKTTIIQILEQNEEFTDFFEENKLNFTLQEMMKTVSILEKHHLQSNFLLYYTEKELNKALVFDYNIEEFYKAKFIQQVLGSNYFSEELKESVIKNWVHNLENMRKILNSRKHYKYDEFLQSMRDFKMKNKIIVIDIEQIIDKIEINHTERNFLNSSLNKI